MRKNPFWLSVELGKIVDPIGKFGDRFFLIKGTNLVIEIDTYFQGFLSYSIEKENTACAFRFCRLNDFSALNFY